MFLEESVINGALHYRTSPDGEWKPVSIVELTVRVLIAERKAQLALDAAQPRAGRS